MNAVEVKNLCKSYGNGEIQLKVLNNLDLTVAPGSIYTLMGASGCGKTTLLSCIVGITEPDHGLIRVLGEKRRSNKLLNIGPRIGFLPQETALIDELTIKETIYYFGNIFQMEQEKLDDRYLLIQKLLMLPPDDSKVKNCSLGEQRRVSFAAALIHEPDLLILDEPTVGLDPLVRENIWSFMLSQTRRSKLAIILTIQCVEEARQADRCGLMRNGVLLEEDTPDRIVQKHNCRDLEEAFLKLCIRQQSVDQIFHINNEIGISKYNLQPMYQAIQPSTSRHVEQKSNQKYRKNFDNSTMKALLKKNLLPLMRQPSLTLAMLIMTLLNVVLVHLCIGDNPKGLKIGIINEEIMSNEDCQNSSLITNNDGDCNFHKISCRYIDLISDEYAEKIFFNDESDAMQAAKNGNLVAVIKIPANFSSSWDLFFNEFHQFYGRDAIEIRMDATSYHNFMFISRYLFNNFNKFSKNLMQDCGYSSSNLLQDHDTSSSEPEKLKFKLFMAPTIIMIIIFIQAMNFSAMAICDDRQNGFWNRTILAGVKPNELLLSHVFIQLIFGVVQLIEICLFFMYLLGFGNIGKILHLSAFSLLYILAGMAVGIIFSCLLDNMKAFFLLSNVLSISLIFVSGAFWPIESMPKIIQYILVLTPFRILNISTSNITLKNSGIGDFSVYVGYISLIVWIIFAFFISTKILQVKKFKRNT